MAILKNEPVYNFKDGDYCKPHHIVVKGSWKEIGFDLATIGKNEYGVKLLPYYSPLYGKGARSTGPRTGRTWPNCKRES